VAKHKPFELDCTDYRVSAGSMAHSRAGAVFCCTIGPVTEEVLAALDAAARSEDAIRLVFPKRPLLLERIEVTRVRPHRVRIAGRVVDPE
jgi:hypothetical protein